MENLVGGGEGVVGDNTVDFDCLRLSHDGTGVNGVTGEGIYAGSGVDGSNWGEEIDAEGRALRRVSESRNIAAGRSLVSGFLRCL